MAGVVTITWILIQFGKLMFVRYGAKLGERFLNKCE